MHEDNWDEGIECFRGLAIVFLPTALLWGAFLWAVL